MHRRHVSFAMLVTVAMLGACAAAPKAVPVTTTATKPDLSAKEAGERQLLVGTWLVETRLAGGGERRIVSRRAADGEFEVMFFTIHPEGRSEFSHEVGLWGASGGIYFTLTFGWVRDGEFIAVPREDGYFDDAYRIEYVSADEFEYQAIGSGNRYRAVRVPDDFDPFTR